MAGERFLIIDHLKFSYEGLFNLAEFYNIISGFFYDKGWDWYEKLNREIVTPEGKQILIILQPWKNISDYYRLMASIKIIFSDVKEVEVSHQGQALKLNQGNVRITFDGYVVVDRKGKWEGKPGYWFLSLISQRYFFREHFAKAEAWIKSDIDDLYHKIKNYLNVFKYSYQT